jgi:hypothetical protein
MPGICRENDTAEGGLIPSQDTVKANDKKVIVHEDDVEGHGNGIHAAPTMKAGSNAVFVGGKAVCNAEDLATCDHPATGSADVFVGDIADAVAIAMGFSSLNITEADAIDILQGRDAEVAQGLDPDTSEALEYGDGGISSARRSNTSSTTGVSGAQDANAVSDVPSPQPSNENGQYIYWLPHTDSRVKPQVVSNLETVSQAVGYQLQVTSGYRSPAYNASVDGAKASQHMLQNAVDIIQTGLTTAQRQQFIQAAVDAGFTAIGIYNTFTHLDIRGGALRAWGPNGSWTGLSNYSWAVSALEAKGYNYPG